MIRGEHRPVGLLGLAGLNKNKVAVDAARIDALPIGERLRVSFNELAFETSLLSKTSLLSFSPPPPSSSFPSPSRLCFSTCSRLSLFFFPSRLPFEKERED